MLIINLILNLRYKKKVMKKNVRFSKKEEQNVPVMMETGYCVFVLSISGLGSWGYWFLGLDEAGEGAKIYGKIVNNIR